MGIEKLVLAISNIYVSSSQTNKDLLNKLGALTSFITNNNAIFSNGSSEIQNHDLTRIFKDKLNGMKTKFLGSV